MICARQTHSLIPLSLRCIAGTILLLAFLLWLTPTIAPLLADGGEIVYTSSTTGNLDIYLMDVGRLLAINLTRHAANDCCAVWSPDGQHLTFVSWRDGRDELYEMDADGQHLRRLHTVGVRAVSTVLSPDRRMIVYVTSREGNAEIYIVDVSGTNQQRLTWNNADDFSPAWRPRG